MRRFLVSLAVGACFVTGAAWAETVEKTVKANARTPVGGLFVYWIGACTQGAIPDARLSDPPRNGNVVIELRTQPLSKNSNCTGNVTGPVFFYTPRKGFKGTDEFTIEYPFSRSESRAPTMMSTTYRLTVQ